MNSIGGGILPVCLHQIGIAARLYRIVAIMTVQKLLETVQTCSDGKRRPCPSLLEIRKRPFSAVLKGDGNLKSIIQAFVRQMKPNLPPAGGTIEDDDRSMRFLYLCHGR
jgi:hypothetical protein